MPIHPDRLDDPTYTNLPDIKGAVTETAIGIGRITLSVVGLQNAVSEALKFQYLSMHKCEIALGALQGFGQLFFPALHGASRPENRSARNLVIAGLVDLSSYAARWWMTNELMNLDPAFSTNIYASLTTTSAYNLAVATYLELPIIRSAIRTKLYGNA